MSEEMSAAARNIQNRVYNNIDYIRTNPDRKIVEWTNMEYTLFRALEYARYGDLINRGFQSVEEFAAKTTCKDRWRQVLNEADRLRDKPKYLCTLQQGISGAQMDEMQTENVILVVPRPYIRTYPADRQDRIWTLAKFVQYLKSIEE